MTMKHQTTGARTTKHDTTALALLGAMFIVLAIVGGASLSAAGTGALQKIVSVIGFGNTSAIEAEQHRQAAVLATLEPMIHSVSADVGAVNKRLNGANAATINDRFSAIDADIAALVAEIKSLRQARAVQGESYSWLEPVGHLDSSVVALRSSLDEHQATYRKDMGVINKRLDKLEQVLSRDLTASIPHITPRRKIVRRKPTQPRTPSPVAAFGPSSPQTMFGVQAY
jgi:Skp family chaperone for outer membrane proteins